MLVFLLLINVFCHMITAQVLYVGGKVGQYQRRDHCDHY